MATRSHDFSAASNGNAATGAAVSLDAGVDTLTINITTSKSSVYTSTPFSAPYAGHEISVIRVIETVPGNDSISTGSGSATVTYSPTSSGSGTIKVEEKVWRAVDEGFGTTYASLRSTKTYEVSVTIAAAANAPTDFTTNPVWSSTANANPGAVSSLTTSPVSDGTSPITYSFSESQSNITINSSTGAVTWTYGNNSTSTQSVTVTATATNSTGSYSENFTVSRKRGPGVSNATYSWPNASWTAQTESVSGTATYIGTAGTWSTSNSNAATIDANGTLSWTQNSSTSNRSVSITRQVTENGYTRTFSVGNATQFGRPADYVSVDSFSVTSAPSGGSYSISASISEFDLSDSTTGTYTITRGATQVATGNVGDGTTSVSHTGLTAPTTYGSYTYTIDVTVGSITNSATATQYVIDRPATPTVTSDNPRSANVTVTVSSSKNGLGTLEYAQSSSTGIPSSGWQTSNTFTQARNTTRYYFVRNSYSGGVAYPSGTKYASKVVSYISPDTAVTATSSVLTNGATDSATTTIAGGKADEVYAVRVNNGSTNLATRTGNGDVTFAPTVGVGDTKTFEIFAKVPTDKGGSNSYTGTNDTFTVKRQVLAPTAVSASHNNAASSSVTVTVSATITAQRQGSGTLQYAQSTTNSLPSTGWQDSATFSQDRNTTRYYWTRVTSTVNTATYSSSASVVVGYRTPDTAVAATSSTITNTATTATTTISNATAGESYAVRVNNGTTNLATRTGNGTVSFTDNLPTSGNTETYEIFARRPTSLGGDGTTWYATNDTFTVERLQDTTSDAFNLGSDITNAAVGAEYRRSFTPVGFETSETFTGTATGSGASTLLSIDTTDWESKTWTASVSASDGDVVHVKVLASSSASTTSTHTVSGAGNSSTLNITTVAASTGSGTLIPLGITTGAIDLNTLRNFFGNPTYNSNTISMSDLYRGGNLVPDITENATVPTSGEIELADLYGSYTYLSIDKNPSIKQVFVPLGQPSGTAILNWTMSTSPTGQGDVDTGYKALKFVSEFRWIFDVTDTSGNVPNLSVLEWGGVNYASQATSFPYTTPWHTGLSSLNVEYDYGIQTGSIAGTVRLEVRRIWDGVTYTAQSTAPFWEVVVENAGE